MGLWDVWRTVFRDSTWDLSRYEYRCPRTDILPQVSDGVLLFGTDEAHEIPTLQGMLPQPIPTFLRIDTDRYQDVDVTARVEITGVARTSRDSQGNWVENTNNWFGITTRALDFQIWDSYLFYIRRDGRIEFGIRGVHDSPVGIPPPLVGPPRLPEVAQQPVTIRIRVEGDRIRTWANGVGRHNVRDEEQRFTTRSGYVYLVTWGAATRLYEVEVRAKVKRWYGPLVRTFVLIVFGALTSAYGVRYLTEYLFNVEWYVKLYSRLPDFVTIISSIGKILWVVFGVASGLAAIHYLYDRYSRPR